MRDHTQRWNIDVARVPDYKTLTTSMVWTSSEIRNTEAIRASWNPMPVPVTSFIKLARLLRPSRLGCPGRWGDNPPRGNMRFSGSVWPLLIPKYTVSLRRQYSRNL